METVAVNYITFTGHSKIWSAINKVIEILIILSKVVTPEFYLK